MIKRHNIKDLKKHQANFERFSVNLEQGFPSLSSTSPDQLVLRALGCQHHVTIACVLEKPPADIRFLLELICLFSSTHFALGAKVEVNTNLLIRGYTQTIGNTPVESNLDLAFWQEMLAVHNLMTDSKGIALMLESGQKLYGEKLEKTPLKTRFTGLFQMALATEQPTEALGLVQQQIQVVSNLKMLTRDLPPLPVLQVWESLLLGDADTAKQRLLIALESHQTYWAKKPDHVMGWISYPLLQAYAWAAQKGMEIAIESDYLPNLLE
jgi:Immunity protein 49